MDAQLHRYRALGFLDVTRPPTTHRRVPVELQGLYMLTEYAAFLPQSTGTFLEQQPPPPGRPDETDNYGDAPTDSGANCMEAETLLYLRERARKGPLGGSGAAAAVVERPAGAVTLTDLAYIAKIKQGEAIAAYILYSSSVRRRPASYRLMCDQKEIRAPSPIWPWVGACSCPGYLQRREKNYKAAATQTIVVATRRCGQQHHVWEALKELSLDKSIPYSDRTYSEWAPLLDQLFTKGSSSGLSNDGGVDEMSGQLCFQRCDFSVCSSSTPKARIGKCHTAAEDDDDDDDEDVNDDDHVRAWHKIANPPPLPQIHVPDAFPQLRGNRRAGRVGLKSLVQPQQEYEDMRRRMQMPCTQGRADATTSATAAAAFQLWSGTWHPPAAFYSLSASATPHLHVATPTPCAHQKPIERSPARRRHKPPAPRQPHHRQWPWESRAKPFVASPCCRARREAEAAAAPLAGHVPPPHAQLAAPHPLHLTTAARAPAAYNPDWGLFDRQPPWRSPLPPQQQQQDRQHSH
ncbi:unnamed protein product [Vitrella brassicaformis CCMP3155]|uniref:Uncharacterized protein n=1 Tax=Vitrella brassicaformis (strain CCMP3155) TaxID=1169540 RepID=A0A0G4ECZ2_VITBC|nr:unnamed protein product [Vitrella brassicaformis CCMP3155]|eukprot:CEL93212.1 unnamed protein product [Vitrella brassicaformis CCMP3155]